ncbi:MAG: F0F1 ATP synthase subunit epsilon [Patescibacteria group bacterium]
MELKIYSLEGTKYEGTVSEVSLPTTDGEITVLPHHVALITTLKAGEIKFKDQIISINGGFAEVGNNKVVVLVN